jgi:outer membrane protein assembly factor BamD
MMKKILILLAFVVFVVSCASKNPNEMSAEQLLSYGLNAFEQADYDEAAKYFEKSIMKADTPEIAAKAQLFLGNSYFIMGDFAQAIPSYEQYLDLYEGTKEEKRVIFRLASSYYKIIQSIDRDQSNTKEALKYFEKLRQKFPAYAHEKGVDDTIRKLRNRLAEKEMYVAEFYFRIGKDEAAEKRLKYILENYQDTEVYCKAALKYSEYLIEKGKKTNVAVAYLKNVLQQNNDKEYLERASEILKKLESNVSSE